MAWQLVATHKLMLLQPQSVMMHGQQYRIRLPSMRMVAKVQRSQLRTGELQLVT